MWSSISVSIGVNSELVTESHSSSVSIGVNSELVTENHSSVPASAPLKHQLLFAF